MKHITFTRHNINWMATCYLECNGLCDVTIEKKRETKKWYQSEYEYFMDFICAPESLDELEKFIYEKLDKKFFEVHQITNFRKEFYDLEDVSSFESTSN